MTKSSYDTLNGTATTVFYRDTEFSFFVGRIEIIITRVNYDGLYNSDSKNVAYQRTRA